MLKEREKTTFRYSVAQYTTKYRYYKRLQSNKIETKYLLKIFIYKVPLQKMKLLNSIGKN